MSDDLSTLAFELGRRRGTPLFVFSPERLDHATKRLREFAESLPFPVDLFYSYKTNYLPALCKQLRDCGIRAEVTSGIEWELARRLHQPSNIVVNGIGKLAEGFLARIATEATPRLINLEADTEIDLVCERSPQVPLRVGLRVCVPRVSGERGSDPSEHWRRGTAKFGWSADGDDIVRAALQITSSPGAVLEALHVHVGSQIVSAHVYDMTLAAVCGLLRRLRMAGVSSVTTLDLGGGLASGWVDKRRTGPLFELLQTLGMPVPARVQRGPDFEAIARVFHRHATRLSALGITSLLIEPGRFLAEPAMMAVATVVAVRRDGARRHAVLDIGTNALHCWRTTETRPVMFDGSATAPLTRWQLVGPLCHRGDTLGTVTAPADLAPGTLVCLDAVGAYSLSDWIANTWHRPAVTALDGTLLWRRQCTADFFDPALFPPETPTHERLTLTPFAGHVGCVSRQQGVAACVVSQTRRD